MCTVTLFDDLVHSPPIAGMRPTAVAVATDRAIDRAIGHNYASRIATTVGKRVIWSLYDTYTSLAPALHPYPSTKHRRLRCSICG